MPRLHPNGAPCCLPNDSPLAPASPCCPHPPCLQRDEQGRHIAGTVQKVLPDLVLLKQLGGAHSFPAAVPPNKVLAELPDGLLGWQVEKVGGRQVVR